MKEKTIPKLLLMSFIIVVLVTSLSLGSCKASGATEITTGGTEAAETGSETVAETEAVVQETTATETKTYEDIEKNFGGEINGLFLGGYAENDAFQSFLDKYGVTLKQTYFTSFDEAFAKLKTSPPGSFDLVSITNCYIAEWAKAGVLEPIDTNLIPNWSNMYMPFQVNNYATADGNFYGTPFTWGTCPLNYNTKYMEKPDSWYIFLDPALKNKVAIVDDPQVIYHAAYINGSYTGDPSRQTPEQLQETIGFLREILGNSNVIAAGFGDILSLFLSEEVWTSFMGWEYYTIGSQAEGIPVELTIPKEGSWSWVDTYCVVKGSENMDTVYGMLNQLISEEAQEFLGNFLAAGIINPQALDAVDPSFVAQFPYDDIDDYLTNVAPLFVMPAREMEEGFTNYQDWQDAWTALKSEVGI